MKALRTLAGVALSWRPCAGLLTSDRDKCRGLDSALLALCGKFTPLSEVLEYGDHRLQRHPGLEAHPLDIPVELPPAPHRLRPPGFLALYVRPQGAHRVGVHLTCVSREVAEPVAPPERERAAVVTPRLQLPGTPGLRGEILSQGDADRLGILDIESLQPPVPEAPVVDPELHPFLVRLFFLLSSPSLAWWNSLNSTRSSKASFGSVCP